MSIENIKQFQFVIYAEYYSNIKIYRKRIDLTVIGLTEDNLYSVEKIFRKEDD